MSFKSKNRLSKFFQGWTGSILLAFLIAMTFKSMIADWNDVPSGSMKPTIVEGDRIFVNKLAYDLKIPFWPFGQRPFKTIQLIRWGYPQRGDIVVFFSPTKGTRLVKRVVGLPGDVIEMQDNFLVINGKQLTYENIDGSFFSDLWVGEQLAHHFYRETIDIKKHAVMIINQNKNQEDIFSENNSFIIMDPKKLKKILSDNNVGSEMIENDQQSFPRIDDTCLLVDPGKLNKILIYSYKVDPLKLEKIMNNILSERNSAKIPKDKYIMIGDNRTNSQDSRYFGFVDRRQIVGRAVAIAISREGSIFKGHFRGHRFFKKLI